MGSQLLLMGVAVVLMIFVMQFVFPVTSHPQVLFASHKSSVAVESVPSMTFSKHGDRELFAVVGTLRNDSDFEWRKVYVEARFFNAKNEMIDAMSSSLDDVVLLPKSITAFRVTGYAAKPSAEYARVDIRVTSARVRATWD